MVAKPPLPDGYELPESLNGWHLDPNSNKNGHAWYSADGETAVAVFSGFGSVRAVVSDERCDGLGRGQRVYEREYEDDTDGRERKCLECQAVVDGIDAAREWMHETEPEEWAYPDVCEAVFDTPISYELEYYFLEDRESTVYYRREDAEKVSRFAGMHKPETYTRETCPYLYVHQWNGRGNATVALDAAAVGRPTLGGGRVRCLLGGVCGFSYLEAVFEVINPLVLLLQLLSKLCVLLFNLFDLLFKLQQVREQLLFGEDHLHSQIPPLRVDSRGDGMVFSAEPIPEDCHETLLPVDSADLCASYEMVAKSAQAKHIPFLQTPI